MSKSKQSQHLPFNPKILLLSSPTPLEDTPADISLLQTQNQIHLKNQSDDQSIFQQSIIRLRPKKTKPFLSSQLQTLKKQHSLLLLQHQNLQTTSQQSLLLLKQKQIQHKHSQTIISDLTISFRASEKRKSVLELQLSKLYNQLDLNRSEAESYEKEITRLLGLHSGKDSELIDLMHRHSEEVKDLKQGHRLVIEEYQEKQEETKKLLKRLNGINQQKEEKLREEIEMYKGSRDKVVCELREKEEVIGKLETQNEILQSYIKNNTDKYEGDLVGMKMESDRVIREVKEEKEREMEEMREGFEKEGRRMREEIGRLKEKVEREEVGWRGRLENNEEKERQREEEWERKEKDSENKIMQCQREVQKLIQQNSKMKDILDKQEQESKQLSLKNHLLQSSLKQLYSTTSALQSQLLSLTKQKTLLSNQLTTLKTQLSHLHSTNLSLTNHSTSLSTSLTQLTSKHSLTLSSLQKLQTSLTYYKNSLKVLETQYSQLTQSHTKQTKSNAQLRDLVIEHENNSEMLKDKCIKLQIFIDNFKVSSERNRERTEKKWGELREVYERQLEELEGKVIEGEKRYSGLKLRLEKVERENKIYEFENTVSPNVEVAGGSAGMYYKK